jgi:signal transduction histidine kinase
MSRLLEEKAGQPGLNGSTSSNASPPRSRETRILIVAPTGSDARHTTEFLTRAGLQPCPCRDMFDLCYHVEEGCGSILLAEEAIGTNSISVLLETLSQQPSWSDIPIILITSGGEAGQTRLRRLEVFGPSGNVMMIERPFRPITLVSALEVALRSRQRQYEVRDLLAERTRATEHLEGLVMERTAALQDTVAQLEAFSYSITHDMRGPLRAITSYAQLLKKEFAEQLSDEGKEYLQRITDASLRLDRLIQDVLQYSRLGRLEMATEPVDAEKLIHTIIAEYPNLEVYRQHIKVECPIPPVRANPSALTQSLSNLLNNAVKFVAPGKTPVVHVFCAQENGHVRITVEDNGIGIAPQHHQQIFGAFNRLHDSNAYDGTGIGLAIVKRAVERMNGRVGVESEVGKGSRFWIELPAV